MLPTCSLSTKIVWMAETSSPDPLRVATGYIPSVASGSQKLRSPNSARSAARRHFVALNPDPASSSSPSSAEHGPPSAIRPNEDYLPDPRANLHVPPPADIHAPPHNLLSPATTVMNVDPAAPVLGSANADDVRRQQVMDEVEKERKDNEISVAGLARRATGPKGRAFIGGFVPWLRNLAAPTAPRPPHPPKHEMLGPHSGMVSMPGTESKTTHSPSQSNRSRPSSFQPLPPIRIESPSSHNTTPFIPPPASIHSHASPIAPPPREPSPTLEGTTLLGHGLTAPLHLRRASTQYVDPATLALPDSPEYQPLPHAADYVKMEAEKTESKAQSFAIQNPTFARVVRFFKAIDELPWIGTERVTADYYPGRKDAEGNPWRFGSYEKRAPPPLFSPTHPHGNRLPGQELGSPNFGFHRSSRYDFGIRRSQFSRMKLGRAKSRSALNSWYDGKSQKSNKELDLLSSGDEIEPFTLHQPLQTAMLVGHTPVSMAPVPLYEQRVVDGKTVDVDVDQERELRHDPDHAEGVALGRQAALHGYQMPVPHPELQPPSTMSQHATSIRSPTTPIRSPQPTHQPSAHSRSRSRDHGSQGPTVYSTKTPTQTRSPSSHNRGYSVDYYVASTNVHREYVPPAPVAPSPVATRTGTIRVGEPKKPKSRTHSRSHSTPQQTAPVYYSTTTPVHFRSPSQDGHHHRSTSRGVEYSDPRRRDAQPMPI